MPLAVRNALLAIRRRFGPTEQVSPALVVEPSAGFAGLSSLRAVYALAKGDQAALEDAMGDTRKKLDEDLRKLITEAGYGEPCRDAQPSDDQLKSVKNA